MLAITPDSRFAHRGLHDGDRPRNSLPAIVAAADAGYGIEFDVHLSSDGIPFISHDPDTRADTGAELLIGATRSEVLRELTFVGTNLRLATLEDVVREVRPEVPLLVEVKPTRRVSETLRAITERLAGREGAVAIQSFQPSVVHAVRRHHTGFAAGQLAEDANAAMPLHERWYWQTLATNAWVRPDFLAVYLTALTRPVVRFWRDRLGIPVLGWTVVDAEDIETCRAADAGLIFERVRP